MEESKIEENYFFKDIDAPPVPIESDDFHKNININNKSNINHNNINIIESNFNPLSNYNNKNIIKIETEKQFHPSQLYNNNNNANKYKNDPMKNIFINLKNNYQQEPINDIKININNDDDYSKFFDFKIDIKQEILNNLNKEDIIDIITFINKYCKIKLESKYISLHHHSFIIGKSKNKKNEYSLLIKRKRERNNKKQSDNNSNIINEKNIIINNKKIDSQINKKILNNFYCDIHKKVFFTDATYENHIKNHQKCEICGEIFPKLRNLKNHISIKHKKNILNISEKNMKGNNNLKSNKYGLIYNNNKSLSGYVHQMKEQKNNNNSNDFETKKKNKEKILNELYNQINQDNDNLFQKEKIGKDKKVRLKFEEPEKLGEIKKTKDNKTQKMNDNSKSQKKMKNQQYFYECYIDKKTFKSEKGYVDHFINCHKNDYPFYCEKCKKGFYSYQAINNHNSSKHNY